MTAHTVLGGGGGALLLLRRALVVVALLVVFAPEEAAPSYSGCPFLEFCGFFECTIVIEFSYPCGIDCCPLEIDYCDFREEITFPCAPKFCLIDICDNCDDEEGCFCIPFVGDCVDCVIPISDPTCVVAWAFGGDGPFCFNGECMLCPCPGGPSSAPPPPPAPAPPATSPPTGATPPTGTETDPLVIYLLDAPDNWKGILQDLILYNVYFPSYMPGWENVAFGHVWNLAKRMGLMDTFQDPRHSMIYSQWYVTFARQICLDAQTRSNDPYCIELAGPLLNGLFNGAPVCSTVAAYNPLLQWGLYPNHEWLLATFQDAPRCPLSVSERLVSHCADGHPWIALPTCVHVACEEPDCTNRCAGSWGVHNQYCDGDDECDWCQYHGCTSSDCWWNGASGYCPNMGKLTAPGNTCFY
jgi:hypothetical protein